MNAVEEGCGTDVASTSHGSTGSYECSEIENDFGYRDSRVPGLMECPCKQNVFGVLIKAWNHYYGHGGFD